MSDVLVLNADMEPLTRVSLRPAVKMLVRQVAEVHDHVPDRAFGIWPMPTAVRLVRYVYARWRHTDGPARSRRGVLTRDHRRSGYCRQPATTVDHIVPRSQRPEHLAQHHRVLLRLQPTQGRPHPAPGGDGPAIRAAYAHLGVSRSRMTRPTGAAAPVGDGLTAGRQIPHTRPAFSNRHGCRGCGRRSATGSGLRCRSDPARRRRCVE
jgi:hypothetical protein